MRKGADLEVLSVYESLCDLPLEEALAELERSVPPGEVREQVRRMLLADEDHAPLLDSHGPEVLADALARDLVRSLASQPAGSAPAIVPTTLGPYRVLGVLGAGAMGVVYEAEQAQPRRLVAIKVVRQRTGDAATLSRFHHEAQVLATMRHPAIPYVVEAAEYEGLGYVVMERVVGEPLDVWARGRSRAERLAVFRALCEGVAYAHAAGVLHRDLKPANILVEPTGQPRILDFGLSVLASAVEAADLAGTVPYLPPEALDGVVDAQADVYALGVVLYELLHDRLPWALDGLTPREALRRKRAPPPGAPRGGAAIEAIARRAVAPDRAERYPTVEALCADLEAEHELRPVSAWRPSLPERVSRWARHNRTGLRWSVVSALAILLTGGVVAGARKAAAVMEHERREQLAWERYEIVEQRLADLRATGDEARADAVFEALGEMPENQGTEALAQAWFDEARRRAGTGDEAGRMAALATALGESQNPSMHQEVLAELGRVFAARLDWEALELLTARVVDPSLRAANEAQLAAGMRRLSALTGATGPEGIVARWSRATRTPWRPISAARVAWGGEERLLLLHQDANTLVVVDPLDLGRASTWPLPPMRFGWDAPRVSVHGDRVWIAALLPGDGIRWRLLSASVADPGLRFEERLVGDGGVPSPMVAGDLDGDGAARLYLGSGAPERRVRSIDPAAPRLEVPNRASDAARSDLNDVLLADLDADGRDELVLSLGAWQAYDVRVLGVPPGRAEADGSELLARRQLGGVSFLARLVRPDGRVVLVVSKADSCPSERVFGPDRPDGEPQGIYVLRLEGGALVQEDFVPAPNGTGVAPGLVRAGDLDGDGLDDVVAQLSSTGDQHLWVLRQSGDGTFTSAIVGGLALLDVTQMDADPELEVLARLPDDDEHLWVLGAGSTPLPPRAARLADTEPTGSERADLLRRLGMRVPAAALLERLGQAEDDLDLLARYLRAAAVLCAEDDEHDRAFADLRTARRLRPRQDVLDAELLRDHLRLALAGHRTDEARDALAALRAHPAAGDLADIEGVAAEVGLERATRRTYDLSDPGALDWHVIDPAAARLDPEGLQLDLIEGSGPALQLPLVREGGPFGVQLDVDLLHGGPGGQLFVGLAPAEGGPGFGLRFDTWGGARRLAYALSCSGDDLDGRTWHSPLAKGPWIERVRFRLLALGDALLCEGSANGTLALHERSRRVRLAAERWVLTIGSSEPTDFAERGHILVALRSLALEGARPDVDDPGWGIAWLRSRSPAILADVAADEPGLAAVLAAEAGHVEQAAAWTRRVADGGRAPVPSDIVSALRRRPGVWIPLVRAHWPEEAFADAYAAAWTIQMSGPVDAQALSALDHPFVDDLPVRPATFELLANRAALFDLAGRRGAARALLERLVASPSGTDISDDDALLQLASVEARDGALDAARGRCARLLETSATPELARDRLVRDPSLATVCGDLLEGRVARDVER